MKLLVFILLLASTTVIAQSVLVMDFVKIKNGKYAEAIYYYENNWKASRDIALMKGVILSYRLEQTKADSVAPFDLVLITEYKDSNQYNSSEENFRKIISTNSPNGPILLNEIKPAAFRQNVFIKVTQTVFDSRKKKYQEK